jgi:enoyl-CoA hydratase/carnithine racemase
LSITGRIAEVEELKDFGLVTEIHENPLGRAMEIADAVSSYSPQAMKSGLEYVRQIRGKDWVEAGSLGRATRSILMNHEDFKSSVARFRKS